MKRTENETKIEVRGAHYRKVGGREAIDVIESLLDDDNGLSPRRKFLVANAMKYLLRLGRKDGDAGTLADLYKAENYLHRARTGEWMEHGKEAER